MHPNDTSPIALILGETESRRSKLMSLRLSSQDGGHIHVKGRAPHQSVEETYAEQMMHRRTYLLVCELTVGPMSYEVRPSQDGHLMLTQ